MTGRRWTTRQVCEVAGCTYRQADYWLRCGVLPDPASGSGSRRTFDDRDVEAFHACKQVADLLDSTTALTVVAEAVLGAPIQPGDHVLVEGHTVRRWAAGDPLPTGGGVIVLIPLRSIDDLIFPEFSDLSDGVVPRRLDEAGSTAVPERTAARRPGRVCATDSSPLSVAAAVNT